MNENKKEKQKPKRKNMLRDTIILIGLSMLFCVVICFFTAPPLIDVGLVSCIDMMKENGYELVIVCESNEAQYCKDIHKIVEPYNLNWMMCDWEGVSCEFDNAIENFEYPAYMVINSETSMQEPVGTGMKNIEEIKSMLGC